MLSKCLEEQIILIKIYKKNVGNNGGGGRGLRELWVQKPSHSVKEILPGNGKKFN